MGLTPAREQQVREFFHDRSRLIHLVELGELTPDDQRWALGLERKWQDDRGFYRSIAEYIEGVKQIGEVQRGEGGKLVKPPSSLPRKNGKEHGKENGDNGEEVGGSLNGFGPKSLDSLDSKVSTDEFAPGKNTPFEDHTAPLKENTPFKDNTSFKNYSPSIEDIGTFFEHQGVVGEERTRELLVYAALGRAAVGIEGLSGSGKTKLKDALLQLLPEAMYKEIRSVSGKALFYDSKLREGKIDFLVMAELQKAIGDSKVKEILKDLSEGSSSTHEKVNSSRDGLDKLEIKADSLIYTFAIGNEYAKSKNRDAELLRRFLVLHTDMSEEQNRKVTLADEHPAAEQEAHEYQDQKFKSYITSCLNSEYEVYNPFLEYLITALPPSLSSRNNNMKSFKRYLRKLIEGSTIYHHQERPEEMEEGRKIIFSTLYDNIRVVSLDGNVIPNNLRRISVVERAILNSLQPEKGYTLDEIDQSLIYFDEKAQLLKPSVEHLVELGLLVEKPSSERSFPQYFKGDEEGLSFDWKVALDEAEEIMRKEYPLALPAWKAQCQAELSQINPGGPVHGNETK